MTVERMKKLINVMIDGMINEEGMHVIPVISTLIDYGFTKEELVNEFYFTEDDVESVIGDKQNELE